MLRCHSYIEVLHELGYSVKLVLNSEWLGDADMLFKRKDGTLGYYFRIIDTQYPLQI